MILSTPFSRQNRNLHSWTNGTNGHHQNNGHHANHHHPQTTSFHHHNKLVAIKKSPAPEEPAPAQPRSVPPVVVNGDGAFRSLNRLDLQKRRWNKQQVSSTPLSSSIQQPVRRNLSSLGHYPESRQTNTTDQQQQQYSSPISSPATKLNGSQIYAPASIASPSEFNQYRRPVVANGESQHYAATSFRGPMSESGRSGRDSALGNLLERFGTLRRRTKWLRRSSKPSMTSNGASSLHGGLDPLQPAVLDPEIYATGKRQVEADAIYAEGLSAIDGNCQKRLLQYELSESVMSEGETRTIIEEQSKQQVDYQNLVETLTNWINDELAQQRIIVRDLQDDLYDGQILGKLVEKLHHIKLDIVEVTQNETTQRYKLRTVLDTINRILLVQAKWARIRWSVDGIHGKNMVEIMQLLVTLALYYRAPIKLPPNVRVMVLVVQKSHGQLVKRSHEVQLTDSLGLSSRLLNGLSTSTNRATTTTQQSRDAFDALIEFAPEKLALVEQSLVNFVNRHLNKINISCTSTQENQVLNPEQFSDGLMLVFLIASLEDYFIPLGNLFTVAPSPPPPPAQHDRLATKPEPLPTVDINNNNNSSSSSDGAAPLLETALEHTSYINTQPIHKLHNVNVALQLIEEAGIPIREQVRAEDIVNGDLKSVLRVLYTLFSRYKHL